MAVSRMTTHWRKGTTQISHDLDLRSEFTLLFGECSSITVVYHSNRRREACGDVMSLGLSPSQGGFTGIRNPA